MHYSGVSLVIKLNLTLFGVASCGWTTVGQSAEYFFPVDGHGMG